MSVGEHIGAVQLFAVWSVPLLALLWLSILVDTVVIDLRNGRHPRAWRCWKTGALLIGELVTVRTAVAVIGPRCIFLIVLSFNVTLVPLLHMRLPGPEGLPMDKISIFFVALYAISYMLIALGRAKGVSINGEQ